MKDEIRRAMDTRLAALESSEARRARIRARIEAMEREEEPIVKRKFSVATALVMALMLLGGTALAAGLGLNLFEILGERDERWRSVADKSVLVTQVPVTAQHGVLGEMVATMTNAYYDGQTLSIAYALKNWRCYEPWMPTEEEKAELVWSEGRSDLEDYMAYLMANGFIEPMTDGEPYGAVEYQVIPNGTITANGIMVPPGKMVGGYQEDGSYYEIIDYGAKLPKGVADREKLEISVPLYYLAIYYWYDGSEWYTARYSDSEHSSHEIFLTATVYRDDEAQIKRFTGTGEYKGEPVTVTMELTLISGEVTITAPEDVFFHITKGGSGILMNVWKMELVDDQGRPYQGDSEKTVSPRELRFTCHGTGFIPESLTMLLYEYDQADDAVSEEEAKAEGVTFTLLPE